MGVAAGDYDNDGCVDLLTTSLDGNRLLHNDCRGVFTDVSARSGLARRGWSVSAAFVDFDRDGWLDLFVGHYLTWDPSLNTPCYGTSGRRVYCAPQVYRAQQSRLYRNNRDGTLLGRDRSRPVWPRSSGRRWACRPPTSTATDGSTSTWPTIARRTSSGSTGTTGRSRTAGSCPARRSGRSASRSRAWASTPATSTTTATRIIVVTNLTGEGHDLYVNDGTGTFVNASARVGHRPSQPALHRIRRRLARRGQRRVAGPADRERRRADSRLRRRGRRDRVARAGAGSCSATSATAASRTSRRRAGRRCCRRDASRGAAFGDVDNDGDTDVVVGQQRRRRRSCC